MFNNLASSSSSLTIYAQLPQNIGIGLSELFAMVASYEFAFFAAPCSAQSLFVNVRFLSIIVASFLGATYTVIFSDNWLTFDFSVSIKLVIFLGLSNIFIVSGFI